MNILEKRAVLEEAIKRHPDIGMMIIDLAWDWVESVNNEEDSKYLMDTFIRLADEHNFLLVLVTHQSHVDRAPKGHQGAQLASKAQTVFSAKKRKSHFIVNAVHTRGQNIDPFAFQYNGSSYEFLDISEASRKSNLSKGDFTKTDDLTHLKIIDKLPDVLHSPTEIRTKCHMPTAKP